MSKVFGPASPKQKMILESKAQILIIGGAAGCLSKDHEVLTPEGWIKINEWSGQPIFQFDAETEAEKLIVPQEFVKLPCDKMIRVEGENIEQEISFEHRVLYKNDPSDDEYSVILGKDFYDEHINGGWQGYIPTRSGGLVYLDTSTCSHIEIFVPEDGFKYCFVTDTGYFLTRFNDVEFYTGNSGKSYLLQLMPLSLIDDPKTNVVMFRRKTPQLRGGGGLFDKAKGIYNQLPDEWRPRFREKDLEAIFPSGAKIKWTHMENVSDKFSHQGLEYTAVMFDEGKLSALNKLL